MFRPERVIIRLYINIIVQKKGEKKEKTIKIFNFFFFLLYFYICVRSDDEPFGLKKCTCEYYVIHIALFQCIKNKTHSKKYNKIQIVKYSSW